MPTSNAVPTNLTTSGKRTLAVADAKERRINQFVRNNPKLRTALEKRQSDNVSHARADIQEVSQFLMEKVVELTTSDGDDISGEKALEALRFMRGEEMHQAKIDKIKADTESVLINVATPTAIRQIINEIGMCIKTGTEEAVADALANEPGHATQEAIKQIGGEIYGRIMQKIQQMGYEDNSLTRMLAAPR